ncbi:RsmB/NOP family class I SAM-dependent RNA methyltransferase [Fonticella tunisiensis]|uniref:16S rRNA (Cytosine1407-C5)-methyltransferase n=1 Tax=Fonticella tunisiensis TaxID=1096341 RepID=A0A4R7KTF2_9CLOT|nr:RsmB/NOP family class I SAM-dependent RNA methyltransferase [Fonticella tunisiensis]TDT61168.1 16S rRNA (cytosine1407-C5)-methyltransferase [Fonticella tunisiensis]
MPSIGQVKKKIPVEFINNLYSLFSPGIADRVLIGIGEERVTTLRVNNIKYDINSLMEYFNRINVKFERVEWYRDALIIKNAKEKDIRKLPIYCEGMIYLQSLSSMIPPLVLKPEKGDKILDLTAAPGSKTTQIASIIENDGFILANEVDKIRAERLKYNILLQQALSAEVHVENGILIGDKYPEYFDKVLLDAPCSGEGRFTLEDARTYKNWSIREVKRLSKLQKKLFESAYKALKKGGIMVYSTCTLNRQENEEVIHWAAQRFDFQILNIEVNLPGTVPGFSIEDNMSIKRAVRILPSKVMEGFFICKLKKL